MTSLPQRLSALQEARTRRWETVLVTPIHPLLVRTVQREGAVSVALRAGLSEELIHKLVRDPVRRMELGTADRLSIALGVHLGTYYPLEEAA